MWDDLVRNKLYGRGIWRKIRVLMYMDKMDNDRVKMGKDFL